MQQVKFGTVLKDSLVEKATVLPGVKGRCVLLDKDPCVKRVAFVESIRRVVDFTSDVASAQRFGVTPKVYYYFLVARLNTDMQGNIVSPGFNVQYLQIANAIYEKFVSLCEDNPNFKSISLTLEEKGTFKFLNINPSTEQPDDTTLANINDVTSNKALLESLWSDVDKSSSISVERAIEMVNQKEKENISGQAPQIHSSGQAPQLQSSSVQTSVQPSLQSHVQASQASQPTAPASQPTAQSPSDNQSVSSITDEFKDDFDDLFSDK